MEAIPFLEVPLSQVTLVCIQLSKASQHGVREMAPWLTACTVLAGDPNMIPSTCTEQVTSACKSSSEGSNVLFWSLRAPKLTRMHARTSTHTHTQFFNKNKSLNKRLNYARLTTFKGLYN